MQIIVNPFSLGKLLFLAFLRFNVMISNVLCFKQTYDEKEQLFHIHRLHTDAVNREFFTANRHGRRVYVKDIPVFLLAGLPAEGQSSKKHEKERNNHY